MNIILTYWLAQILMLIIYAINFFNTLKRQWYNSNNFEILNLFVELKFV